MGSDSRDGIIKTTVTKVAGWFRSGEEASRQPPPEAAEQNGTGAMPRAGGRPEPPAAALPRASMIAQKIAVLKETLELSPNLKPRIEKEQSLRALLILASDELLFRFNKLGEIGFLGTDSVAMISLFNQKIAAVLTCKDDECGLDPREEVRRLTQENLALKSRMNAFKDHYVDRKEFEQLTQENMSLKHKIKVLQADHVKKGVITERELVLEKENESLKNLMRDEHQQLLVARKKGEQLADWQEMVHSLKAKNNLLNSKVEYQVKLLHSFTTDHPKQQELMAMMEELTKQNNQLRRDLEQQSEMLQKVKPEEAGEQLKAVAQLIEGSLQMHSDLDEQRDLLDETKGSAGVEENLLDRIERLTENNANLRNLFEVRDQLHRYMEDPEKVEKGCLEEMATKLKAENDRLGEEVKEREERFKFASEETPSSTRLFRTCVKLRNEKRELARENQLREEAFRHEAAERQLLQKRLLQAAGLHKENLRLRSRVQEFDRLTKLLNKLAKQNELLKKERGELQLKTERATIELTRVNEKMGKITREYNALMTEYEKLFAEQ